MRPMFLASICILGMGCGINPNTTPLPTGDYAIIATRDSQGMTGALNTVKLSDKSVQKGVDTTIDQDSLLRTDGNRLLVLNRSKSIVRIYDKKNWTKAPIEIALGDDEHPAGTAFAQDVLPIAGTTEFYVTLSANDAEHAIGVIDSSQPGKGVVRWIKVPPATDDPDGKPEPSRLYGCAGLYYATIDDLDFLTTFAPIGPGRVVILNPSSNELAGTIQLMGQNPSQMAQEGSDCHNLLVMSSGPFGVEPDGRSGIERIDLAARQAKGMVANSTVLGGVPFTLDVASKTLAFTTIFYDLRKMMTGYTLLATSKVIAFNPSTGKVIGDVTGEAGFIPFANLTPDGGLFVGVNVVPSIGQETGKLTPGVYVGKADGNAISASAIDLGQDPASIAF